MTTHKFDQQETPERHEDERLHELLQAWSGIEPSGGFQAGVWRRVRCGSASDLAGRSSFAGALLFKPLRATAVAAVLGILLGVWAAFSTAPAPPTAQEKLMHFQTLNESYVSIFRGDY